MIEAWVTPAEERQVLSCFCTSRRTWKPAGGVASKYTGVSKSSPVSVPEGIYVSRIDIGISNSFPRVSGWESKAFLRGVNIRGYK